MSHPYFESHYYSVEFILCDNDLHIKSLTKDSNIHQGI